LVLGLLDPQTFLEGRLPLQVERAHEVLAPLAEKLGFEGADAVERTADAAVRVASGMMATEVRKALARRGADPADYTLIPYGGAGPTHAALLAGEAGIDKILVAPSPGTFCALGAAVSDLRRDFVRSVRLQLDAPPAPAQEAELRRAVETLISGSREWVNRTLGLVEAWRVEITADLHYPQQAFDLTVTARDYQDGVDLGRRLAELFHKAHHAIYDFSEPSSPAEISRIVVSLVGALPSAQIQSGAVGRASPARRRRVRLNDQILEVRVLQRTDPALEEALSEPLIIEQADTTIVVPPGWITRKTASGSLHITRDPGAPHGR
jgi:N-methylhydantoinase A